MSKVGFHSHCQGLPDFLSGRSPQRKKQHGGTGLWSGASTSQDWAVQQAEGLLAQGWLGLP